MFVWFSFCYLWGRGAWCSRYGANTSYGSVHLRIAYTHTQRYVVWYQWASVDICRNTCVASVERKEQILSRISHGRFNLVVCVERDFLFFFLPSIAWLKPEQTAPSE